MMIRKTLILLLSALTIFASAGCTHESASKPGTVVLTFSTGDVFTKTAVADGTEIAFNNNDEPDLFLAITNSLGQVLATYPGSHSELLENASPSLLSVKFTEFNWNGEFTVYAVANTANGVWGAPADAAAWQAISSATDLDALTFTALTGDYIYEVDPSTGRMPLSAKGTLSVNESHNGHADIELKRCVAKIAFKFKNETSDALTLENCVVVIKDINPTTGYIFPHTSDATGTVRDLNLISSTIPIASGQTTTLYGYKLVFPSVAPARTVGSRYYCDISFEIQGVQKSFTDLPIHDRQSRDITSLDRNQYLQIETRINRGLDVSFNFIVQNWNENPEEIIFH